MRIENLKPINNLSSGLQLRTQAAKAISDVQLFKDAAGKQVLSDFFLDAAVQAGGTVNPILPGTSTVVASGVKRPCGPVTGSGTFATITVVGGVITGIVLSAS